jgi:hypothetical protein
LSHFLRAFNRQELQAKTPRNVTCGILGVFVKIGDTGLIVEVTWIENAEDAVTSECKYAYSR